MTTAKLWRWLALPGMLWLAVWVVVPAYAILAVALGHTNFLLQPVPAWNPGTWDGSTLSRVVSQALPGGQYWSSVRNTLEYVGAALGGCLLIGYPVAYYASRYARRTRGLLLALLLAPFCINYLLRMLAWIGLLSPGGYINGFLQGLGFAHPPDWLDGNAYSVIAALIYGYLPYFILPVFAGLDRIDRSHIEAARDLGASPARAFFLVTLPLSWGSVLAGSALTVLPMFGDYFTNDLISGSPRTNMLGNVINLFIQGGPQTNVGASLVIVLMGLLTVIMAYYVYWSIKAAARSK